MRINVIGWYGHNNIGDESYKISFPKMFPKHSFTFSENINNADIHILGGGDVVYGDYLKKIENVKNKYIISTTISNDIDLKDFKYIAVRDLESFKKIKNYNTNISIIPDISFLLSPNKERGKFLIKSLFLSEKADLYNKTVAVIINGNLIQRHDSLARDDFNFYRLSQDMSRAMDNIASSFIFIPFGTDMPFDDRIANSSVVSKCKFWKKNINVLNRLSVQDTLDIISACDATVSMRLHSTIFSCLSNVPYIDIIHNHKNKWFAETSGYKKNNILYENFSQIQFLENLSKILYKDNEDIKELSLISNKYKSDLDNFSLKIESVFEGEK